MSNAPDPLAENMRGVWRAALARHEAERAAGRETESVRAIAEKILALINDKPAGGLDTIADIGLRAALSAAIMAEVEALERRRR